MTTSRFARHASSPSYGPARSRRSPVRLTVGGTALAVIAATALVGLPASVAQASPPAPQQQTVSFTSPGTYTYTVLPAITTVSVHASGGSGGDGQNGTYAYGGAGGDTTSTLTVVPGQTLQINVGGAGSPAAPGNGCNLSGGGFNGGGAASYESGTGAGASDVRDGAYGLADRLVVAGGGGGAGVDGGNGGQGGNPATDGHTAFPQYGTGGGAGTQVAGGSGGTGSEGNGATGAAGIGGDSGCSEPQYSSNSGGGGGGYFGGGGGGANYGEASGGGGGSSFGPAGSTFTTGTHGGNGAVTLTFTAPAVGAPTRLTVSPSAATTSAGQAQSYTAEAFDIYGDDLGDVTSSSLFSVVGGTCSANSCTVTPAGDHTVTATYAGVTATATQTVRAATSLVLSAFPSSTAPGVAHDLVVDAQDAVGAAATNDNDALQVTSTDGNAVLPGTAPTLVNGHVQFAVTLNNAGSQTITVTDATLGISATVPAVAVSGAVSFTVTGYPTTSVAGDSGTVTVRALDSGGNLVTDYAGTVHLSSSDPAAALPADATLTDGVGFFSVSLRTSGTEALTATGVHDGSLTGTESGLGITPGPVTQLLATAGPATAGASTSVTVHGADAYGNITPWTGTAHFTTSDTAATVPADTAASSNAAVASFVFHTAGAQTVDVTDATAPALTTTLALTVAAGAPAHIRVTPNVPLVAGVTTPVTFAALDAYGNVVPSVYISSTNPYASFYGNSGLGIRIAFVNGSDPAMTFTDSPGFGVPPQLRLLRAGSQQVYIYGRFCYSFNDCSTSYGAGTVSDTSNVSVAPAAAAGLTVTLPSVTTAGDVLPLSVDARDSFGNQTTLADPLTVTSSDPLADLPSNATLAGGTYTGSVTLKQAGSQTVTVTDSSNAGLSTAANVTVTAGPLASLAVTGYPAGSQAGDAIHTLQVVGNDAYGNTAGGYAGTMTVTSSDPQAVLPSPVTAVAGVGAVPVELRSSGHQTITVTDATSGLTGSESVTVGAAGVSRLVITPGASPAVAGAPQQVSVRALDVFGNLLDADTDTLTVSASDAAGSVPATVDLAAGVGSFTMTARTAGTQTITVSDPLAAVTGIADVKVVAGAASSLTLSGLPSATVAGAALPVTVTALDAQGNIATGSAAVLHLTSSDPKAQLPDDVALVAGVGHLALSLSTAGSHTVTASADHLDPVSHSIAVAPGRASSLSVTTAPTAKQGVAVPLTVKAFDPYGNLATNSSDSIRLSSSDTTATLPTTLSLTAGQLSSTVTWHASGPQTLTATDLSVSGLTGFATDIAVTETGSPSGPARPGAPTVLAVLTGRGTATVHFKAPRDNGGARITSYTVTSSPDRKHPLGFSRTASSSPITVTGLQQGDYYTFSVTATNAVGAGPASAPSKAVNPSPGPSPIALHYAHLGGAGSVLGLPTGPEHDRAGGSERAYQHGVIVYSFATGARMVNGPIAVRYTRLGGPSGRLGYPLSDERAVKGGRQAHFQHGDIDYRSATRTLTVTYR